MNIQVRPSNESDGAAICSLLRKVAPLLAPDPTAPGAAAFLESLESPAVAARLAAPNFLHFLAESGPDLLGYIALRDGQHLYHLFVQPEHHGQGIARLLWHHMLNATDRRPITVNSSLPAVPVYGSFGFVPAGEPQLHCCPPYVPLVYAAGS